MSSSSLASQTHSNQALTPKQTLFVKNIAKGMTKGDAAISAGYSPMYAQQQSYRLLKNKKITQALEKVGLTDSAIAKGIKTNIDAGLGIKATASDSLRGLELVSKLKGHLDQEKTPSNISQTNIYIDELKQLSDNELSTKLDILQEDIAKLKTK
jgi:phage terminase small subunit